MSSLLSKHIISLKSKTSFLLKIHFLRTGEPSSQSALLKIFCLTNPAAWFRTTMLICSNYSESHSSMFLGRRKT